MPRRAVSIDVEAFQDLVDDAAAAFLVDPIYAVAMIKAQKAVTRKRAVWKVKKDLKEGEKQARELCAKSDIFVCENRTVCGGGNCKFAQGDLTLITIESVNGSTKRPQQWASGGYELSDAFEELLKIRSKSSRQARV